MKLIEFSLPVRTVFANLLVRKDSLKCVFEDLLSTHFLSKRNFIMNHTKNKHTREKYVQSLQIGEV